MPATQPAASRFQEASRLALTAQDVRFTTRSDSLYAFVMAWPESRQALIKRLATGAPQTAGAKVTALEPKAKSIRSGGPVVSVGSTR